LLTPELFITDGFKMAERKSFLLRIDSDLWADLEAWAQDELRSVNGQIEYLLRQAVLKRKGSPETVGVQAQRPKATKPHGKK
jgi:hypothetical protein